MKNEKTVKELQNLTKTDPNTGKFVNAQRVGNRISIGIVLIVLGILYSIGGISLVISGILVCVIILLLASIVAYILIKTKVI